MALRTVGVRLTAEIGAYQNKLRAAAQSTRDFKGELDRASKSGNLDKVADRAAAVGVGLAGMAVGALKMAADFDKAMSGVRVGVQDAAGHMGELRAAAIQAGKDTQYSATQAAQGITELGKAGIVSKDVLGGGLKGALDLAAAGQLSVGEAAETAASAMTQFKLTGSQVPHVADLLAAAAGKAQGSVHDMGYALSQSGLVANQFGLSIEDTTGVLAEFANAGLIGSDAGTSLKTMLLALTQPSEQTSKRMDALGISFYDAQGKFIGLSGVAEVLRRQLGGLSDEQRQATLKMIFGNDAIRAASILYADGAKGVEDWKNKVNDAGYASETAAKLTDNLAGDIERLKGSLETLAIQAGSGPNSGIRVLTKGLNGLVNQFLSLPASVSSGATVLAGLSGAALLLGAGWVKARKSTAAFRAELEALGPAGVKASAGLSKVTSVAGKIGGVFAALEVAYAVIGHFQKDLNPQTDALAAGLGRFASSGQLAGEASRVLGNNLDDLKVGFAFLADGDNSRRVAVKNMQQGLEGLIPPLAGTNTSLTKTQERITAVDDALAGMVSGGNTDQAKAAFDALGRQLAVGGVSMEEFRAQFPKYAAALETAGSATKGTANKLGSLGSALQQGADDQKPFRTQTQLAAAAARGERDAITDLGKALKAETDPVFAMLNAQDDLTKAQKDAAKAVEQHGKKSKEAKEATRKLAEAAIGLQMAAGSLGSTFDGKLSPAMRATLKAAGLTDSQIKAVAGQFRDAKKDGDTFAKKYEAKVSAPGAKQAKKEIDDAYTSANGFKGPYEAKVSVTGYDNVKGKLDNLSAIQQALKSGKNISTMNAYHKGYSEGGWTGPGAKYEPAGVVHRDEFVVNKAARGRLESQKPGALDYMNQTGEWPGYVGGGHVLPYPVNTSKTKIPSKKQVMDAVTPEFGNWPSSPSAQRGDSGIWRRIVALVKASGIPFTFGNAYRAGDPLWHGSGRAVDFMGFNQDRLANFFLARQSKVLELIHRTKNRDYGITRGRYHAMPHQWPLHKNHLHVAMAHGGVIPEHVIGLGRSGRTYEFGEAGPERVTPLRGYASGGLVNVAPKASTHTGTRLDTYDALLGARNAVAALTAALKENGRTWSQNTQKGRDNRAALISGVRAAQAAAKAKYDETGSIKAANKVYDDYIKQLDRSLKAMHVNARTRKALIKAYSERPTYDDSTKSPSNSSMTVKRISDQIGAEEQLSNIKSAYAWQKPSFNIKTEAGRSEFTTLFAYLSAAQQAAQSLYEAGGNASQAKALYNGYLNQLRSVLAKSGMSKTEIEKLLTKYARMTLTSTSNRWGGVYEHAASGKLTDAQIAGAGPTRYAWAESSTGGELFAPKHGNLQKTRREVSWAVANWWGGQTTWGGKGGPAGAKNITVQATIPIQLGSETITKQVEMVVDAALGQVVNATVYQTA